MSDYFQYCYVTTDWSRTMQELSDQLDIGEWYQMPDAEFDTGENRTAVCHFALAYKADLQFEIIQPVSGDCSVYQVGLPQEGYGKAFHHLGRHFGDKAEFETAVAEAMTKWDMPIAWDTMGGTYAYFDARKDTGHFIEYFAFPPGSHLDDVPRY